MAQPIVIELACVDCNSHFTHEEAAARGGWRFYIYAAWANLSSKGAFYSACPDCGSTGLVTIRWEP